MEDLHRYLKIFDTASLETTLSSATDLHFTIWDDERKNSLRNILKKNICVLVCNLS